MSTKLELADTNRVICLQTKEKNHFESKWTSFDYLGTCRVLKAASARPMAGGTRDLDW